MKLDFDIKTKGTNLDFDMKDTTVISQSAKKEIVVVDIQKMLEEQNTTLFMDLSQRYANGEIVIIGSMGVNMAIVNAVGLWSETTAHWVVTSGAWGEPMLEGGAFEPIVEVYGVECNGEEIVIGSGVIRKPDLADYAKKTDLNELYQADNEIKANIGNIENDIAVINNALNKFDETIKYDSEKTYNVRTTADDLPNGYSVIDGSKTVLKKVVGSTVACKNLIQYPYADTPSEGNTVEITGITFTDNGDGSITVNGTSTQNTTFMISSSSNQRVRIPKVGSYHLSGSIDGGSKSTYFLAVQVRKGNTFLVGTNITDSNGLNFTVSEEMLNSYDNVYMYFWTAKGQTFNNTVFKPMLNEGSTALPYQPYFTGLKSASFAGIESESADGTKKDTFVFPKTEVPMGTTIDFEREKIVERTKEIVLDGKNIIPYLAGTQDWDTQNIPENERRQRWYFTLKENFGVNTTDTINAISDVYKIVTNDDTYMFKTGVSIQGDVIFIYDDNYAVPNEGENRDELKQRFITHLTENPVTIRYLLVEPIETPFTEEQLKAGDEYRVFVNGTEKVINDGADYGADNTLTQNYIAVKVKE